MNLYLNQEEVRDVQSKRRQHKMVEKIYKDIQYARADELGEELDIITIGADVKEQTKFGDYIEAYSDGCVLTECKKSYIYNGEIFMGCDVLYINKNHKNLKSQGVLESPKGWLMFDETENKSNKFVTICFERGLMREIINPNWKYNLQPMISKHIHKVIDLAKKNEQNYIENICNKVDDYYIINGDADLKLCIQGEDNNKDTIFLALPWNKWDELGIEYVETKLNFYTEDGNVIDLDNKKSPSGHNRRTR